MCNVVENRQLNKHKDTGTDFSKELGKHCCWPFAELKGLGLEIEFKYFDKNTYY